MGTGATSLQIENEEEDASIKTNWFFIKLFIGGIQVGFYFLNLVSVWNVPVIASDYTSESYQLSKFREMHSLSMNLDWHSKEIIDLIYSMNEAID